MRNKKVAIITMHKVVNFGSALQAWALQECIKKMGYEVQIIDYKYPNEYYFTHVKSNKKSGLLSRLKKITFKNIKDYLFLRLTDSNEQYRKFQDYCEARFQLTKEYTSLEELRRTPPQCDIYMTGSDQVWNPNTMFGDPSYFLDFGDSKILRVSYASSFSVNCITEEYQNMYSRLLSHYDSLSVREKSGQIIINNLINKKAYCVCDPTLLLSREHYLPLAENSTIKIRKPYLLAYILDYAFNPYPTIEKVISQVSKSLGLHVVYLLCGNVNGYKRGATTIANAGPNEFVRLFADAEFVVTSSFHGTAFSIINRKSFYAVVPSENKESRILSLLKEVKLENRAVFSNRHFVLSKDELHVNYSIIEQSLMNYVQKSLNYLENNLLKTKNAE